MSVGVGEIDQRGERPLVEDEPVDYLGSSSRIETARKVMYRSSSGKKESLHSNNEMYAAAWEPILSSTAPCPWGGEQVGVTLRAREHSSTEVLFPALVDAEVAVRNSLFDLIRRDSTPEAVCKVGFHQYEATGRERCLSLTVSLLEDFGSKSWPVLSELAKSERPECELFVGLIAHCDGIPSAKRASALSKLAAHPDAAVRIEILDNLADLTAYDRQCVLETLTDDSDADICEEANQRLLDL